MEIGRRLGDVAEAGNLEDVKVRLVFRRLRAPLVGRGASCRLPVVFVDSEFVECVAADPEAAMAGGASKIDEFAQPVLLRRGQRLRVAREKGVEP